MAHDRERLIFLFGEDALDELEAYDLDQEADVIEAVERFLPMPQTGSGADPLRAATRTVAVRQILGDNPPETWRAVARMQAAGLDSDQVFGQLAMVIAEHLLESLMTKEPSDPAQLAAALDALPLPSTEQIAKTLVGIARAEPGIDADELVDWVASAEREPDTVYAVHGEPAASAALAAEIHRRLDWTAAVPRLGEVVRLTR